MKNYLIIGASSGIGKALAQILSEQSQVFATFSSQPKANSNNCTYFHLDVMAEDFDLSTLPDTIHGIAYCPGRINLAPFARLKPDSFLEDYKLQVLGAVRILQAVLPQLRKAQNASIVFFSTVAVQQGFNFHSEVASSKGAIEGLTRALAAEFAPHIRVNAVAPSLTDTPLAEKLLNKPEKKEANAQRHPLKKIGSAQDIAEMAAFLLSEKSSWITGQILHVDGGMSSIKL